MASSAGSLIGLSTDRAFPTSGLHFQVDGGSLMVGGDDLNASQMARATVTTTTKDVDDSPEYNVTHPRKLDGSGRFGPRTRAPPTETPAMATRRRSDSERAFTIDRMIRSPGKRKSTSERAGGAFEIDAAGSLEVEGQRQQTEQDKHSRGIRVCARVNAYRGHRISIPDTDSPRRRTKEWLPRGRCPSCVSIRPSWTRNSIRFEIDSNPK